MALPMVPPPNGPDRMIQVQALYAKIFRVLVEGHKVYRFDPWKRIYPAPKLIAELPEDGGLGICRPGDLVLLTENIPLSTSRMSSVGYEMLPSDFSAKAWHQYLVENPLEHSGLFLERPNSCRGLFLDRDGVVLEAVSYMKDPKSAVLKSGIASLFQRARDAKLKIFLITNQSGIGRGTISWEAFDAVQNEMQQQLAKLGHWFDQTEWAPYFANSKDPLCLRNPESRKPGIGMIDRIQYKHGIDLETSVLIGDRRCDLETGHRAGIKNLYLMESAETDEDTYDLSYSFNRIKNFSEITI